MNRLSTSADGTLQRRTGRSKDVRLRVVGGFTILDKGRECLHKHRHESEGVVEVSEEVEHFLLLLRRMAANVDEGTCLDDYLGESDEVAKASER